MFLYVSQLINSLIYMQKLIKYLNYLLTFFSSYCIFQNLTTRKKVLIAKQESGLYLLECKGQNKTKVIS